MKEFFAAVLEALAGFLEREGGRSWLCVILIFVAAGLWKLGFPKADDLFVFALGVLAREMGSKAVSLLHDGGVKLADPKQP